FRAGCGACSGSGIGSTMGAAVLTVWSKCDDAVGSTCVGSTCVGSTYVGSTYVGSTYVGSTYVGSICVDSICVGSTCHASVSSTTYVRLLTTSCDGPAGSTSRGSATSGCDRSTASANSSMMASFISLITVECATGVAATGLC